MGYYDSVKDSVRNNNQGSTASAGGGSFDTLKENAEKTSEEENKGDDTPIEVLEEDGLSREPQQSQKQKQKSQGSSTENSSGNSNPLTSSNSGSQDQVSQDISNLESKMDKLIEQNKRMIEILESFGQ